jgi:hypothetical protein
MSRSPWALMTGSMLVLAGCLTFSPARAESEPFIAMAVDPTPLDPTAVAQAAWPMAQDASFVDTFGHPTQVSEPQVANLAHTMP